MENKIIKYFFSFILSVILFVSEVLLIVQYNVRKGINKQDINRIIDTVNIENEIMKTNKYKELEDKINPEILQNIIESEELSYYIKENAKSMCNNILYNENNTYVDSENLKQFVSRTIEEKQLDFGITEEEIELINKNVDDIIKEINEGIQDIETYKTDIKIISTFLSKKATTILLGISILIGTIIVLINRSKDAYMFIGLTTLIVGVIFFILWLALSKTIVTTGIDEDIIRYVSTYLPTLLKTLKKSSIIMSALGAIGCTTYTIMNYQEVQSNGKI